MENVSKGFAGRLTAEEVTTLVIEVALCYTSSGG